MRAFPQSVAARGAGRVLNLSAQREGAKMSIKCTGGLHPWNVSRIKLFLPVQPLLQKYSDFPKTQITFLLPPSRSARGAMAIVTDAGTGCGGRGGAFDEQRLMRTEKSCGPDASTLASSLQLRRCKRRWQKSRSPGRSRRKPLKPLRAGMPGDFRCDRCEYSCAFCTTTFAHEAAGALGTRHSRAPSLWGRTFLSTARAQSAPRELYAGVSTPSLRAQRSNPCRRAKKEWIASLRSQ